MANKNDKYSLSLKNKMSFLISSKPWDTGLEFMKELEYVHMCHAMFALSHFYVK